jgi:hypothetical protein
VFFVYSSEGEIAESIAKAAEVSSMALNHPTRGQAKKGSRWTNYVKGKARLTADANRTCTKAFFKDLIEFPKIDSDVHLHAIALCVLDKFKEAIAPRRSRAIFSRNKHMSGENRFL